MTTTKKNEPREQIACRGGVSFDCRRVTDHKAVGDGLLQSGEHWQGRIKKCFRCFSYLGCSVCAQRDTELICLNCDKELKPPGNWGTKIALKRHGRIVRDREAIREAWKIVQMRGDGAITQEDSDKLFVDLFKKEGPL